MSTMPTEKEFSKHLNTKFRIAIEPPVDVELTEVKSYVSQPNEQPGMERFSVYFTGPANRYLPQQVYPLQHEVMGALDVFLVPVARDENGFRYEAVFNYFKQEL